MNIEDTDKTNTINNNINEEQQGVNATEAEINPLEEAQNTIKDLEDQLKRSLADYQNLQKRVQQEREQMRKYGAESTIRALMPTLDNFHYAWKSLGDNSTEGDKFQESMKMIYKTFIQSLEGLGLKVITPEKGDGFNAELHEVVMQMDSEIEEGKIAEILSPGYQLYDRVLKVCQVASAKKPEGTKE